MLVYSVSEFNKIASAALEKEFGVVFIQGEVSGFKIAKQQLVYFELKDKNSRLLCFLMRWELKHNLKDGMEIRVMGVPRLFQSSGGFHLRVEEIELVGEGALQAAFEALKIKLANEGLFDVSRKRTLPKFPQKIGLITSKEAAAYSDVLRILENRWAGLEIEHISVGVQGLGSIRQIVSAFKAFNFQKRKVDVIILTRGGGSLEDLQPFNSEEVVRAVFASFLPVVVGVGHERDITLADLAADVRASTPSNAAEIVTPDKREIISEIKMAEKNLANYFDNLLKSKQGEIKSCMFVISESLKQAINQIKLLILKIESQFKIFLRGAKEREIKVNALEKLLKSLSPRSVLKRGYSIARKNGQVLRNARDISIKDKVSVEFYKGGIITEVIGMSRKVGPRGEARPFGTRNYEV